MLTAAFDASGDKNTSTLTVAGFISSEKDWQSFSEQWTERLQQDEVEFFRAVDLASFRGPFEHWNDRPDKEKLRRALSSDLMDILKRHVYRRFGCTVINKALGTMDEGMREKFHLCAYSIAGRTCEKHVRQWIVKEWTWSDKQMPIRILFEAGDEGKGNLQRHLSEPGQIPPSFDFKKDFKLADGTIGHGYIPLQAADWFAYELSLAVRQIMGGKVSEFGDLRWPMQQFETMLGNPGTYAEDDIQRLENSYKKLGDVLEWEKQTGLKHLAEADRPKPGHLGNARGKAAQ